MESRHAEYTRLLTGGYMDPQTTGGQMRPPYSDLCRPPGADTSSLSAYHSRYLPSMPLSTGSSFPFLGGMYTGSLPGPPTSPFRSPSTPGVNNMRQFWPPTPPPDGGYGRLALNTNLFPLFGTPADNGAFLTQGLVSRLGSATHLSPLIDHKEHSFFSHGIGLGSPLTPTSHVTSPSPFPHLIPSLERHPAYGGHMTLGSKELDDLQQDAEDSRLMKSHLDCLMKQQHDIPSSRQQDRPKSKSDGKHCCDNNKTVDDCCSKLSSPPACIPHDGGGGKLEDIRNCSKFENKNHSRQQPASKIQPCKIEVNHSPALKPDLLSPPIESPKSDVPSPSKNSKKSAHSPFGHTADLVPTSASVTPYEEKPQTRCSQCCANIKDVGIATKLGANESKESTAPVVTAQSLSDSIVPQSIQVPIVTPVSTPVSTSVSIGNSDSSQEMTVNVESKSSCEKESSSSPVITISDASDKSSFDQSFCKSNKSAVESPLSKSNNCNNVTMKHVTAAVIPTAPKQIVHRDIHPEVNCSAVHHDAPKGVVNSEQSVFVKEQKSFCTDNYVKLELIESSATEKTATTTTVKNSFSNSTNGSFSNRSLSKNPSTSCKVKDMIKNACSAKQMCVEKVQEVSPSKNVDSEASKIPPNTPSPKSISSAAISTTVSPMVMSKSPCKNTSKAQYMPLDSMRKYSPFKEDVPSMKTEAVNTRLDCEFTQKTTNWTKATVSPFNWQGNNNSQDEQAINLTVSKKIVKPEPSETVAVVESTDSLKIPSENTTALTSSGVIGVCHPNPNPIAINKMKAAPAVSSISNFASISVLNQPSEQSTEVHILHRSSKSSFPLVNRNGASPVPLKSTISHVTANTSIHRSLKTERLMTKRGKISEMDKIGHGGRTTLATLAPKLSKNVNFGKDVQTSHTISASSSVSSTSIVFPATVNPCIPVGIAIAQQRQDSSTAASIGKPPSSVPSSTPNVLSSNAHLSTNRVTADLQTHEVIRDQKAQDLPMNNNPTPVDTNLLVTQGPTIVSRQWESEALTRTALPSSWVTHGSIVAPAVWLGQGTYATPAAPASNAVPSVAVNSLESSPISLPPGGYQLARDSITGHLLLIPTANIELMDRPSVWPTFNSSAGSLPIQQLVTQQQHTQFEQVIPQPETLKTNDGVEANCNVTCDIQSNVPVKAEDKMEDVSGQVPSVPLATGQTYAFTTFPTQCDPSGFSYVLQSSTVMHLAHTQTTASIQTESGRRSQATSPLHCATPSPPPNTCSVQVSVTEDEEESDNESDSEYCEENRVVQVSGQSQSVTTAIQVDMDSQTNSEEDDEEDGKVVAVKLDSQKMEMCDSANQTESVECESPKPDPDSEMQSEKLDLSSPPSPAKPPESADVKEEEVISAVEPGLEIVTSETELAPSLPVESKPVMDFIDHHGLNLLVDSIEEFASREQETHSTESPKKDVENTTSNREQTTAVQKASEESAEVKTAPKTSQISEVSQTLPTKSFSSPYKTIDTTCTDGLGLLCALAEQRFFEEALNDDSKTKPPKQEQNASCFTGERQSVKEPEYSSSTKENSLQSNSNESSAQSSVSSSPSHREATEMEMRLQIEELQKKYKQKQRELELLRNKREKENSDEEAFCMSPSPKPKKEVLSTKTAPTSQPESAVTLSSQNISKSSEYQSQQLSGREPESIEEESSSKHQNMGEHSSEKPDQLSTEERAPNQDSDSSHQSGDSSTHTSDSSSGFSEQSLNSNEESKAEKPISNRKKNESSVAEQENDKSKTPFFDEQAWFVRRSERIFLSDARSVATTTPDKGNKKQSHNSASKGASDTSKEKKEHTIKLKNPKSADDTGAKRNKTNKILKPKTSLPKKRSLSVDSESDSSSDDRSSEAESSDDASSTSENLPLSAFVEHSSSNKGPSSDRQKRLSTDSEYSSGQSEDLPLSALIEQKIPELKSCILKPEDLQENSRLLVLDEGLFYAGHITKSEDPDMYGILIDGDRAARPHMFSKEEILNAAVLEVKPAHKLQLPEGSRICAFWSQQYRCLYPGTVTKASSPLPDPSMLYVEFDDGDSGRIPLNDIRMLPSDFPIVSMEPNPFMILGKRRSRAQSQNNANGHTDVKSDLSSNSSKCDKVEHKKLKTSEKVAKKGSIEGKVHKDKTLSKSKSPSATSRSRSSSKSSVSGQGDTKAQSTTNKKESPSSDEKKKLGTKLKHPDKKSKDSIDDTDKSILKPKKHKKHKDDHHKHHHHHHKHHHHKKHKAEKPERSSSHSSSESVIHASKTVGKGSSNCLSSSSGTKLSSSSSSSSSEQEQYDSFILENSKSDLTMKIKKSPSPHTHHEELAVGSKTSVVKKSSNMEVVDSDSSSSDESESSEPPRKKHKKSKQQPVQGKPSKRKERVPSVEKSKIAGKNAFLPVRQLWRWSGKSFRRPGAKGKAKKEFYRSIQRGKETIRVGDCAVFLSTGRPHLPYIGRIETMWESWGGKMDVKVKWFYHPEETKSGKKLSQLKGALFQSPHFDENDVQTISHKCEVLSWSEYQQKTASENIEDNNDTYFLAGTYDPIIGTLILEPGVPNICSSNPCEP